MLFIYTGNRHNKDILRGKMDIIDINVARARRNARLSLLRDFNLAGKSGADKWKDFICLARETGFKDTDFRMRLGADLIVMRLWQNGYAVPEEWRRQEFKKTILGTLFDRYGFPSREFKPF